MNVLDVDMNFFLNYKTDFSEKRTIDEDCKPWNEDDIIEFLEKNLGLNKENKIKGRVCTKHNESFNYVELHRIKIDLDDIVILNYAKFENILEKNKIRRKQ